MFQLRIGLLQVVFSYSSLVVHMNSSKKDQRNELEIRIQLQPIQYW
jgi:hypothetical protein